MLGERELASSSREKADDGLDRTTPGPFCARRIPSQARTTTPRQVENFSKALRLDPGHIWSLLSKARSIGKPEVTEAIATHAIDRYPSSRAAYYLRGTSLLDQGKYALAVEDFEMVHQLKPNDYLGSFWAGMALHNKGDDAAALEKLKVAAVLNPGSGWVPLEKAEVFMRLGQHDPRHTAAKQVDRNTVGACLGDYEFAQRLSTRAHLQRARIRLKAGNKERAQADVDSAYQIARNHSQTPRD